MKSSLIPGVAVLLLILLVGIQSYYITDVYELKEMELKEQYAEVAREVLQLNPGAYSPILDSLYTLIDYSGVYYRNIKDTSFSLDQTVLNKEILGGFYWFFHQEQAIVPALKRRLLDYEMDTSIALSFKIQHLSLIRGFIKDTIFDVRESEFDVYFQEEMKRPFLVYNMSYEGNDAAMKGVISLGNKNAIMLIIKEMIGILLVTLFTLVFIVYLFIRTWLNLQRQKALSDLKTDFINNLTHELKTPLSIISLATKGISKKDFIKSEAEALEIGEMIEKQNKHLSKLLDKILDINVWERDAISLKKERVDLVHLLQACAKDMRTKYKELPCMLEEQYAEEQFLYDLDPIQMVVAVNNLLDNAMKYAKGSKASVLSLEIDSEIRIVVKDFGPGMDRISQSKVFDRFVRGETGDVQNTKGLGLGLYYVKKIAEAHGGEVSLSSGTGKGATFTIHLPCGNIEE